MTGGVARKPTPLCWQLPGFPLRKSPFLNGALIMNRSFLIIILPAIAVALGYIFVLHWLGYELEIFRFVMAGIVAVAAIILVQWYQRRKSGRRNR